MIKFTPNDYNSKINTNFKANDKKDKKMDDIQELVRKVIDEAELKVTDVGPFSVKEEQKDTDPCHFLSSFGVIMKPLSSSDDKSPRVVRFYAINQSKTYEHESANKAKGTREDILEYLKFGDFAQDLQEYTDRVSSEFYFNDNI